MAYEVHAGGGNKNPGGVLINGQTGMLVRFAGCCSPVPGDEIVGYTSRGRGVVVHRCDCVNVKHSEGNRLLPASWQIEAGAKQRYNANISIRATDQGAALSVLSQSVSDLKLSITSINGRIDKNGDAIVEASISLSDISEVDSLIKKMKADRRIYDVHRITSLS
jgi:GTP pyrophosphokinase